MTTVPHALERSNRIAVFVPHWLGDAVMALPATADIRRARPDAEVIAVARPSIAPLFEMVPSVTRTLVLDDRQPIGPALLDPLKALAADAALLFPNSLRSAFVAWRGGIPARFGFRAECRGVLLTRSVTRPAGLHQAESYQRLVEGLGIPTGPRVPDLEVPALVRDAARARLARAGWDGRAPLVAFAPGAANGRAKQWPPESFAIVADQVVADGGVPLLVGTAGDLAVAEQVVSAMTPDGREAVVDLTGSTDLPALAGVLVHCRTIVTNDSGGMHLAAALGVPVIALFGPTREDEVRPLGPRDPIVLTNPVWCRPCMLKTCPIDHRCMRGLRPEVVIGEVRKQAEKPKAEN